MSERDLEYYMHLPYRVEVYFDSDGECWGAEIPELPGFVAAAETWEELHASIADAKRAWFDAALEEGLRIPEPARREEFSGRVLVRMPKSLHADLTDSARREGVSLNHLLVSVLSRGIGWPAHATEILRERAGVVDQHSVTAPPQKEEALHSWLRDEAIRRTLDAEFRGVPEKSLPRHTPLSTGETQADRTALVAELLAKESSQSKEELVVWLNDIVRRLTKGRHQRTATRANQSLRHAGAKETAGK